MSIQDKFNGEKLHVDVLGVGTIATLTANEAYIDTLPLVSRKFDNGLSVEMLEVSSEFKGMGLHAHFNMKGVAIAANTTLRVAVEIFQLPGSANPVTGTFTSVDLSSVYGPCVAPACVDLAANRIYLDVVVTEVAANGVKAVAKCDIDLLRKFNRYLRFKFTPASLTSAGAAAGLAGGQVTVVATLEGSEHPVVIKPVLTPELVDIA